MDTRESRGEEPTEGGAAADEQAAGQGGAPGEQGDVGPAADVEGQAADQAEHVQVGPAGDEAAAEVERLKAELAALKADAEHKAMLAKHAADVPENVRALIPAGDEASVVAAVEALRAWGGVRRGDLGTGGGRQVAPMSAVEAALLFRR